MKKKSLTAAMAEREKQKNEAPGHGWHSAAYHRHFEGWAEIERRDLLFLCWSVAARQSEWVDREWRYALENKGLSFIEPIPLDPPSICPPPKELSSKHFNDRGLLYMNR